MVAARAGIHRNHGAHESFLAAPARFSAVQVRFHNGSFANRLGFCEPTRRNFPTPPIPPRIDRRGILVIRPCAIPDAVALQKPALLEGSERAIEVALVQRLVIAPPTHVLDPVPVLGALWDSELVLRSPDAPGRLLKLHPAPPLVRLLGRRQEDTLLFDPEPARHDGQS